MQSLTSKINNNINHQLDKLYSPFSKFMPKDSFRYLICGGFNTALDIILYFITYNFIIDKQQNTDLIIVAVSPHITAFIIVFPITFYTGFILSKHFTFSGSALKGNIQLFRFGITVFSALTFHYLLLKFFVEFCNIYPTPSKIITSAIIAVFSYFSHKYFSFGKKIKA